MGAAPLGERRVVQITGGSFEGPQVRGEVIGGADWQIVRGDGAIELDARYAIKEARGGIVQVVSQGMRHGPPEVLARLGRGEDVAPSEYFFRTIMRFETGASELRSSTRRSRSRPPSARRGASSCRRGGFCSSQPMWLLWLARYQSAISSRVAHHTPSNCLA